MTDSLHDRAGVFHCPKHRGLNYFRHLPTAAALAPVFLTSIASSDLDSWVCDLII